MTSPLLEPGVRLRFPNIFGVRAGAGGGCGKVFFCAIHVHVQEPPPVYHEANATA